MSLFNKISSIAQNAVEKTNEMLETNKLGTKITGHKTKINELKAEIGDYYWEKYSSGEPLDEQPAGLCVDIQSQLAAIKEVEAEILRLKDENARAQQTSEVVSEILCPACGAENGLTTKFCKNCGNKLEIPAPPEKVYCSCGTEIPASSKFCPNCGKQAASITLHVTAKCACGAENPAGTKFCQSCGTALNSGGGA